jgi:hypothetical protein
MLFGFPTRFVHLVMKCVETASFFCGCEWWLV